MAKPNFSKITESLQHLINIKQDCDAEATINNISESSEFKGLNVWILVFAIFLASIGLNVNSTAVIIGAMLVSPLMGPIMGIGLAIGISDLKLLKKSLKNLLVMTLISLLVSSLYFFVTPLSDAQSELLARTRPTIFDVLIASFGGFAGIVASSRKQEKTTVVSGVAIATALMPPLCTAGYGLGTGQINYFLGAFYLFFINSFFIALATFLIIKYLEFPEKEYMDENRRKKSSENHHGILTHRHYSQRVHGTQCNKRNRFQQCVNQIHKRFGTKRTPERCTNNKKFQKLRKQKNRIGFCRKNLDRRAKTISSTTFN